MAEMLLQTIEQIGREKNIEPEVIIDAIEEAMEVAAAKFFRTEEKLEAKLDPDSGDVKLYAVRLVVEEVEDPQYEIGLEEARQEGMADAEPGDEFRTPMPTEQLGRIAAQAAKQVIFQKVRDAERENIYNEFKERIGELVTGIVKRFERGDMIVDLGRTIEAILPRREQSRAEHYNIGDRIRVVIIDVLRSTRGPQIVVSRSSPELLRRLFEMEVPEIYDGTVEIKEAVREGGDRAKVAVASSEPDVDPVGACVGMRGSRVQSIIRELHGEKIDIVEWSSDPDQFAINSLKPARVNRVNEIVTSEGEEDDDEQVRHLEVIVNEDQLSLAIGKRGQNVRLAGKLLGRKIDVKSEEQKREEIERALEEQEKLHVELEEVPGVGPKAAETLREAGLESGNALVNAGVDALVDVPGIGDKTAEKMIEGAEEIIEERRAALEQERRERAAAEEAERKAREEAERKAQEELAAAAATEEASEASETSTEAADAPETATEDESAAESSSATEPGEADAEERAPETELA